MGKTRSRGLSRRQLLALGGATVGAPLLSSCTGSGDPDAPPSGTDGDSGAITWWDHKSGLWITPTLERAMEENPGLAVEREEYPASELVTALQLGRRSDQMPDVHTAHPNLGPVSVLVQEGWFQPLSDHVDLAGTAVADRLVEGIHVFDGKVYSFPLDDGRSHEQTPWVVTDRLPVDVDPDDARSWDGFRRIARDITRDDMYAIAFAGQGPNYLNLKLHELASAAGATHVGGVDYSTGEYVFDSQPFIDAMEFLLALHSDGVFHPSLGSMGPEDAAQRWAAGEAHIHWHGPWVPGTVTKNYPELLEQGFDCWRMPGPDGAPSAVHFPPPAGEFWISSASQRPGDAATAIAAFASEDTFVAMVNAMAAPPVDETAIEAADVLEPYRRNLQNLLEEGRYAPAPEARNPAAVQVVSQMQGINPNPGEILQGALTGTIDDWRGALTEYTSAISAERDRAIEAATSAGEEVSVEDWVFSNWAPANDFTADDYA
ncbi:ABC transporter substrate-binding protein [Ruania alba]|uniref:Extracellular solute-binding protein n=1 Tax=Ruania alba TaxID=648782 RepID=A0A1H5FYS1_9MICO|nr:ABC transporter substrate-binding protein [Ruania alba]SEE08559.1 extracellular solute-binding protein [Ruania alba]